MTSFLSLAAWQPRESNFSEVPILETVPKWFLGMRSIPPRLASSLQHQVPVEDEKAR